MIKLRDITALWMGDFEFETQEEANEFMANNSHIYFKQIETGETP